MNGCTSYNGTVAKQNYNESDEVSWGEFLRAVITVEYNVPYSLPFSGTDVHPPHAITQTNILAQLFKRTSDLAINSLV